MAEFSPLATYKKIAEQFNITGDKLVSDDMVIAHVQAQKQEMKAICNRLLIDIVGLQKQFETSTDDMARESYKRAISGQEDELRQYSRKMDVLIKLEDELGAA